MGEIGQEPQNFCLFGELWGLIFTLAACFFREVNSTGKQLADGLMNLSDRIGVS